MTDAQKHAQMLDALRRERSRLRAIGDRRVANVISEFIDNASDLTVVRLYDLITGVDA